MTDEERRQSNAEPQALRDAAENLLIGIGMGWDLDGFVEKLRAALAQSDAEPVGILHNAEAGFKDIVTRDTAAIYDNNPQPRLVEEVFDFDCKLIGFRVYDTPPRPDASAGLIEAAEWHEELAKEKLKQAQQAPEVKKRRFLDISFFHDECASALRARAAERSGK